MGNAWVLNESEVDKDVFKQKHWHWLSQHFSVRWKNESFIRETLLQTSREILALINVIVIQVSVMAVQ
jgi:hypothetical protein